ncbi:MAG: Bax inhibitor-1 family protein [Verrucomicrobia bacterium]|nr:Bax inhibitor-1 family protein [Verrucomicrobiota bacterium]MBU6446562.1 Bax inhibitor-1 family protein [Verrucomicrobiota bacterium]
MSAVASRIERAPGGASTIVPDHVSEVNEKIGQVYLYTAATFATTCITAQLSAMSGLAAKVITLLVGAHALTVGIGLLAVAVALMAAIYFTSSRESVLKHSLFGLFAVFHGVVFSPLVLINSSAFAAAAATTVVMTGGLGWLATKIQTQFERFEKIMLISLSVIAAASLGSLFLTGVAGTIAHTVSMVGGFALFSAYIIYDTQMMRKELQTDGVQHFDVIDRTMKLYLNAMNLFTRLFELFNQRSNSEST